MGENPAGLHSFIDQLNQAYESVNRPSLSTLRKHSQQALDATGKGRVLAESTVHDLLTGKRTRFPDWALVASLVTALRTVAAETGLDPAVIGSIADWSTRLQRARAGAGQLLQHAPAPETPTTSETAGPDAISGPDATAEPAIEEDSALAPAQPNTISAPLTLSMHRMLEDYGRTGGRLLRHAENGDGRASYQLSVLLLCDDQPREARVWLRQASETGHSEAPELYHDPLQQIQAAEAAYAIGQEYEAAGHTASALVFYQAAARCGHPDAIYQTGFLFTKRGDNKRARQWYRRAAAFGHPDALADGYRETVQPWPEGHSER